MSTEFVVGLISLVVAVIGWLLRQKDAQQQESLKVLFTKHDQDAKDLQELRLIVAREYYGKGELDQKLIELKNTFKDGFDMMGKKFDRLSDTLMSHMKEHGE